MSHGARTTRRRTSVCAAQEGPPPVAGGALRATRLATENVSISSTPSSRATAAACSPPPGARRGEEGPSPTRRGLPSSASRRRRRPLGAQLGAPSCRRRASRRRRGRARERGLIKAPPGGAGGGEATLDVARARGATTYSRTSSTCPSKKLSESIVDKRAPKAPAKIGASARGVVTWPRVMGAFRLPARRGRRLGACAPAKAAGARTARGGPAPPGLARASAARRRRTDSRGTTPVRMADAGRDRAARRRQLAARPETAFGSFVATSSPRAGLTRWPLMPSACGR